MARFVKLVAFVASALLLGVATPSARADMHFIALDGSDTTVKPEEYGYKVDTYRSERGNACVTIRLRLTEEAAKSFRFGRLTLTKGEQTMFATTLGLDDIQKTADNGRILTVTFASDGIDGGELVIFSQEVKGQPINRGWGGVGGFRLSIKTMLAQRKAADGKADKEAERKQEDESKKKPGPALTLLRTDPLQLRTQHFVFQGSGGGPIHRPSPEHFKVTTVKDGKNIPLVVAQNREELNVAEGKVQDRRRANDLTSYNYLFKGVSLYLDNGFYDARTSERPTGYLDLFARAKLEPGVRYQLTWACWPVGATKPSEVSFEFELSK